MRGDTEVPLIPRYFDLLVLLVERRNEAVNREEIFDKVWNDVIVSDGAMTQAIRILRKSLGDPAKDPRFIRTVSRHGYQFIYDDIAEEPDIAQTGNGDTLEQAIAELMEAEPPKSEEDETRLRDAAETVLRLGAEEDLSRINDVARALLRDVRWDMADSTDLPSPKVT